MGYPIVEVLEEKVSGGSLTLKLRQDWYLESGEAVTDDSITWFIPLFVSVSGKEQILEFNAKEQEFTLELDLKDEDQFVNLNNDGKSFIRVKYNTHTMKRLVKAVKDGKLSVPDKTTILSDTVSFMKSGKIPHEYALELLGSFTDEKKEETVSMILFTLGT
mmetsp:Transcript_62469/g.135393  ORF Transcript_62469/g.135393 Transcript_62469/m.135393 type:complete len:161 (-) Transcript_62469:881-1363(-)